VRDGFKTNNGSGAVGLYVDHLIAHSGSDGTFGNGRRSHKKSADFRRDRVRPAQRTELFKITTSEKKYPN